MSQIKQPKNQQKKPYVKVARFTIDPNDGTEMVKNLNQGGEAQLWTVSNWEKYLEFVTRNPQVRGTIHYPWTFIEFFDKPTIDLSLIVLLPEITNGKELLINNNAN